MKLLIKSKGKEFICQYDRADKKLINQFRWSVDRHGYAVAVLNGKRILMHRLILGILDNPDVETDHKFHDKLDNRRSNIRVCTHAENKRNSRKFSGSSKFKGVYKDGKYYHSQIFQGKHVKNLGRFRSEITAGRVYDQAAKETFKDFAYLNFPDARLPIQKTMLL